MRFGLAVRQSFDEVFDGQRTGRYRLAQLSKVEKTYIGTKIEIIVQAEFGLQRGTRMDYLVSGQEVDSKWSMRSGGWMIPTEAVGELCLCLTADDDASVFSVGVVRADDVLLRTSSNQDRKRTFNETGLNAMSWLVESGALPENLLLHLDSSTRSSILDDRISGQQRVNQLFRLVQKRVVLREVLLTIAKQDDGPKRARDARRHLQPQGILVLGHQGQHPRIARELSVEVPVKGSWISCRVVPAASDAESTTSIGEKEWRAAREEDQLQPGPLTY